MQEMNNQPIEKKESTLKIILITLAFSIPATIVITSFIVNIYSGVSYNPNREFHLRSSQQSLIYDCNELADLAKQHHRISQFKGDKYVSPTFKGFNAPIDFLETTNGKLEFEVINDNELRITATGKYTGNDNKNPIKVRMTVLPYKQKANILN